MVLPIVILFILGLWERIHVTKHVFINICESIDDLFSITLIAKE